MYVLTIEYVPLLLWGWCAEAADIIQPTMERILREVVPREPCAICVAARGRSSPARTPARSHRYSREYSHRDSRR
jgi:hypothetical protein